MSNIILLCHGQQREFAGFDLPSGGEVQYRGNFGTPLSVAVARSLVAALLEDPTISDQQIAREIHGYRGEEPLSGPGSFRPDFSLRGDDRLPCFLLNLTTRRWAPLGRNFESTLHEIVTVLTPAGAFWLNLLCCSTQPGASVPEAWVDRLTEKPWPAVLNG